MNAYHCYRCYLDRIREFCRIYNSESLDMIASIYEHYLDKWEIDNDNITKEKLETIIVVTIEYLTKYEIIVEED